MPDSAQEKTEPPTPRRRSEARKAGQIARSSDLTAAVVLLGVLLLLKWYGGTMFGDMLTVARFCLEEHELAITDPQFLMPLAAKVLWMLIGIVLPALLLVMLLSLLTSLLQIGYIVTFQPFK